MTATLTGVKEEYKIYKYFYANWHADGTEEFYRMKYLAGIKKSEDSNSSISNVIIPSKTKNDNKEYDVIAIGDGAFYTAAYSSLLSYDSSVGAFTEGWFASGYTSWEHYRTFAASDYDYENDVWYNEDDYVDDNEYYLNSIYIPNSIEEIGEYSFGAPFIISNHGDVLEDLDEMLESINNGYMFLPGVRNVAFENEFNGNIDSTAFEGTLWLLNNGEYNTTYEEYYEGDIIKSININGTNYSLKALTTEACFLPGTKVLTANGLVNIEDIKAGNTKAIQELKVGDKVKTQEGWKQIEKINITTEEKPADTYTIGVKGSDYYYANGTMVEGLK